MVEQYEALARVQMLHELTLVPNECRDWLSEVTQEFAHEFATMRVVNSVQDGWSLAVNIGLCEVRYALLCYTNVARIIGAGSRVAAAIRHCLPEGRHHSQKIRENWQRRLGSLLYNLECRMLFDLSYWEINGTPQGFLRTFEKLLCRRRDDDMIDVKFNVICRRGGYPMLDRTGICILRRP